MIRIAVGPEAPVEPVEVRRRSRPGVDSPISASGRVPVYIKLPPVASYLSPTQHLIGGDRRRPDGRRSRKGLVQAEKHAIMRGDRPDRLFSWWARHRKGGLIHRGA